MPETYKCNALFDPVKLKISYIWKSLYKIIEKKYNNFLCKNPDYLNSETIPFLKIQFCRRERLNWEKPFDLYTPSVKAHKIQHVVTVVETEKTRRDKRPLIKRTQTNKSGFPNNGDDDDQAVKKMMDEMMNFDTKVRTYDIIEKQILFDEIEDISLPIDVVFLESEEDYSCDLNHTKMIHEQPWMNQNSSFNDGSDKTKMGERKDSLNQTSVKSDILILRDDVTTSLNELSKFDGLKHHMLNDKEYNMTLKQYYDELCQILKMRRI
jgi:hypothetical protein